MLFNIIKSKKENIGGLSFIPSIGDHFDDLDNFELDHKNYSKNILVEFSECNRNILKNYLLSEDIKCILEIGVLRPPNTLNSSSTGVFLKQKSKNCLYIGIDIEDRSYLDDKENNIYTLKTDSSNYGLVIDYLKTFNIKEIDFLFIDGFHSVNQVIKEWKYTKLLSKSGIVGFHDTNFHPGPYCLFDAIDENLYIKEKYCESFEDWGIAFARKRN